MAERYPNAQGQAPSGGLQYGGAAIDAYSHGPTISDADVADIVSGQILNGELGLDPSGIYIVLASPDIAQTTGLFQTYCAMHGRATTLGFTSPYVFVGSPARSPARCAPQMVGPNGTLNADAMVSHIAAALFNTVTDPTFGAWFDRLGLEPADKCVWTFGTTYTAPNGALANVHLGSRDYLAAATLVAEQGWWWRLRAQAISHARAHDRGAVRNTRRRARCNSGPGRIDDPARVAVGCPCTQSRAHVDRSRKHDSGPRRRRVGRR
jgi:hypothetical protein